ncbi:zinc finger, SWIM-type [Artemisia annua]|uniref:Zinc finger, SWIM-type n=1 Tax=Artemisia annua TaxID=35608 RepID=A0A2U1NNP4_ARTAN|nr:zinc finger, SWIM-type [Artemisia annua]
MSKIKNVASNYKVMWNGGQKYQVTGSFGEQMVVDVERKTCTCRRWEISGLPYRHAVAAKWNMAVNGQPVPLPEAWVDKCYWLETWKEVYSFKIQPCTGRADWKKSPCLTTLTHPHYHPQVGRPKKKRVKGQLEDTPCFKDGKLSRRGRTVRCSSCGNPGHNKQSCKGQGGATTSGSKNTSTGRGRNVEAFGGSSGIPRPRKRVRFCLDDYIEGSPSFVAREDNAGIMQWKPTCLEIGTPPFCKSKWSKVRCISTRLYRKDQRHPNCNSKLSKWNFTEAEPGSPRWEQTA